MEMKRMHYNCLIVDDEAELAMMTCEYFQMFDVSCTYVESVKGCVDFLKDNQADMILLDINLGDGSGFALCKRLREESNIPILFISARQSDDDVLTALNIGGDDYIKKPYTLSILLAKVKIVLNRMVKSGDVQAVQQTEAYKDICIYEDTMSVSVGHKKAVLKAREFQLFKYLFENRNKIVKKDQVFQAVWGDGFYSDGTLNVHIRKLREKLEEDPNNPKYIKTIWGTGYILEI
jgi:two-component system response regulator RegX3